jgi:hypothetical protein
MYARFLGAFAKLRKVTISFVISVCPSVCLSVRLSVCLSVRMEQVGFHWTDFHEIIYLSIFGTSVRKFKFY